jgi:hypothetical protein
MNNAIRYTDLWRLLRKLGFDCDTVDADNHRICESAPTDTRIVLHDYPADQPVREAILMAVRLQLDNSGILLRAEFDRWAARRAKAKATSPNGRQRTKKSPKDVLPPG